MIKEAIEYLLELRKPTEVVVTPERIDTERVYLDKGYALLTPHQVAHMPLATLDSMVEFVRVNNQPPDVFFVVGMDGSVRLVGQPHPQTKAREYWAACELPPIGGLTQCGEKDDSRWMPAENMIPLLLTQFNDNADMQKLLLVLGNVRDGAARTYADDGVTQQVTTRAGVELAGLTTLPSPLELLPRASYPEVNCPGQQYVLRAQGGDEDNPPTFWLRRVADALFEYNRCMLIADYLRQKTKLPVV